VLGVCNGFQILTEAGLLAGALTRNESRHFACRDVFVKVTADGPFTRGAAAGTVWRLPIAHGEGRWQARPDEVARLEAAGAIALRYCDADGNVVPAVNPNGSVGNVAGIYGGPKKNVFGLMPHPERMSEPILGGDDGRKIFDVVVQWISSTSSS